MGGLVVGTQVEGPPVPGGFGQEASTEPVHTWLFIAHNAPLLALMAVGIITAGFLTLVTLLLNGVLIGDLLAQAHQGGDLGVVLAGILPHAPFELAAIFLAAAVGFAPVSVIYRIAADHTVYLKTEVKDLGLLICSALFLLVAAAMVEAWVTPLIIEQVGGM